MYIVCVPVVVDGDLDCKPFNWMLCVSVPRFPICSCTTATKQPCRGTLERLTSPYPLLLSLGIPIIIFFHWYPSKSRNEILLIFSEQYWLNELRRAAKKVFSMCIAYVQYCICVVVHLHPSSGMFVNFHTCVCVPWFLDEQLHHEEWSTVRLTESKMRKGQTRLTPYTHFKHLLAQFKPHTWPEASCLVFGFSMLGGKRWTHLVKLKLKINCNSIYRNA